MDVPLHAGGEQLLFLLFVLFSIVTALLERRKRKKQREESLSGGPPRRDLLEDEEEDVEETGSWPFPMGGDPFELPQPRARKTTRRPATEEEGSPPVERPATETRGLAEPAAGDAAPRRTLIEELADTQAAAEAQSALEKAQADADVAPSLARFTERQPWPAKPAPAAQQVQPRRRVQELVRERVARDKQRAADRKRRKRGKWALTPKTAQAAVVYMEILGRPKAERLGEDFRG